MPRQEMEQKILDAIPTMAQVMAQEISEYAVAPAQCIMSADGRCVLFEGTHLQLKVAWAHWLGIFGAYQRYMECRRFGTGVMTEKVFKLILKKRCAKKGLDKHWDPFYVFFASPAVRWTNRKIRSVFQCMKKIRVKRSFKAQKIQFRRGLWYCLKHKQDAICYE